MPEYWERYERAWTEASLRLVATPSAMAKSTLYYVQEIGHFQTSPAYFTERQYLHSYLIVYTVSGEGQLTYQGKTYALKPGNAVFYRLYGAPSVPDKL